MQQFNLKKETISNNIKSLKDLMNKKGVDVFYLSSFDAFLNEYVPMIDCHRYYFTGFTGSVAEALVLKDQKVKLYVDGRYHEQADNEVDLTLIDVVKVPQNQSLTEALLNDLANHAPKVLGLELERTSFGLMQKFEKNMKTLALDTDLMSTVKFDKIENYKPIEYLYEVERGSDTEVKLSRMAISEGEAIFVSAIDSVSWLSNCRGYHLPHLSSILAKAFVTKDKVFLFKDKTIPLGESTKKNKDIVFYDTHEMEDTLLKLKAEYKIEKVSYQSSMLNSKDYLTLKNTFGEHALIKDNNGLVPYHSIKEESELRAIEQAFERSSKAVYQVICWVKDQVASKKDISERDIYNKTSEIYREHGAVEQSFNTISGAGANGSIIHYSDPKDDLKINENDMILLDSGAYYEAGFATDKTRTFMASYKEGDKKQKEIYTLVLKGFLRLQAAIFPSGATGGHIDAIARAPLYAHGYDYAHGTGHGVGIHVHEPGARIASRSNIPMKAGQVVSIEPGIYIPGLGGVRLENVVYVQEHDKFAGFLCFKNLTFIGLDHGLIDDALLTAEDKQLLQDYEKECQKRGTSFVLKSE